jgi:hypothetical protein
MLADPVKLLLTAVGRTDLKYGRTKRAHVNQVEALTRTFTEQIEMFKAEAAGLLQAQLANTQPLPSASSSYARSPIRHPAAVCPDGIPKNPINM